MLRERTSNDLCTPQYIIAAAEVALGGVIDLDPCSNEWAHRIATTCWSVDRGEDGLELYWGPCARIFVNPPYGRGCLLPWARKISHSSGYDNAIVSLMPHDVSTKWWATMWSTCSARCDFNHRVPFEGGAHSSGVIRNAAFYHGRNPFLFAHAFQELGEIEFPRRK
jgi:hypothetical protein